MSHHLNSLTGAYIGDFVETTVRIIRGDSRSLDSGSHVHSSRLVAVADGNRYEPRTLNPKPYEPRKVFSFPP